MDWKQVWDFFVNLAVSLGAKLLGAVIVLLIGLRLIGWFKKWMRKSPRLDKLDEGVRTFLSSFGSILLYVLLFITIAMILGVPVTSFITILASCGVAVGLALQGSLSNLAGGIMILLFKPFKVGDYIDASGESGTVAEISVVYTVLLTTDNKRITIPNGTLTNSVVINYSAEELRRVDFTFTAAYGCDVNKVKSIIEGILTDHPLARKDPAPLVRLARHGDNALEYTARVWVKNEDYWSVYYDVQEQVKQAFDENQIQIPFPQVDVHIDK